MAFKIDDEDGSSSYEQLSDDNGGDLFLESGSHSLINTEISSVLDRRLLLGVL